MAVLCTIEVICFSLNDACESRHYLCNYRQYFQFQELGTLEEENEPVNQTCHEIDVTYYVAADDERTANLMSQSILVKRAVLNFTM